jgi:hypothetical protein
LAPEAALSRTRRPRAQRRQRALDDAYDRFIEGPAGADRPRQRVLLNPLVEIDVRDFPQLGTLLNKFGCRASRTSRSAARAYATQTKSGKVEAIAGY